ncbi:MAG: SseB family protein [Alphaproteobacteria bacterium]
MLDRFFRKRGGAPDAGIDQASSGEEIVFTPVNAIEQALVAAVVDAGQRAAFNRLLIDSTLYAATNELPAMRGTLLINADALIQLRTVPAPDGTMVPAIFTAPERLAERFGRLASFTEMRVERLFELVSAGGAILNPGLPISVHWTRDDIAALLGRPIHHSAVDGVQVVLAPPRDAPAALVADLRAALAADRRTVGAWLALAQWPGRTGPSWLLDVRSHAGREDIRRLLEPCFRRTDFGGRRLELIFGDPAAGPGIGLALLPPI